MKSAPAIPLFGDAYIADTRHLSLEEHGAYLQLMMIAWRAEDCSLPNDDARIARMIGVTAKKWGKLKPTIMAFWALENGRWTQKRLTKERTFVAKKLEQNRESANARWKTKSLENKDVDDANASLPQCERNAPPPPPTSSEAIASGGEPPNPVKMVFDVGVQLLVAAGTPEKRARSLLGKWRKARGDGEVLTALIECRTRDVAQPVEWMEARLRTRRYVSESGYEYRSNDPETVMRESEKRADWNTYWRAKGDMEGRQAA